MRSTSPTGHADGVVYAAERIDYLPVGPSAWFFSMANGSKIITLADQFADVLELAVRPTPLAMASRFTACATTMR